MLLQCPGALGALVSSRSCTVIYVRLLKSRKTENWNDRQKETRPDGAGPFVSSIFGWGSTYLAIRIAVREGSGFPPFTMAFVRVTAASAILLIWAKIRRERIRLSLAEMGLLAGTGVLLWVGGNGLVNWSETRVSSGLAALLVAAMPVWAECMVCVVDRRFPGWWMVGSVLLGFLGVGVLS